MPPARTGSILPRGLKRFVRVRLDGKNRVTALLVGCRGNDKEAAARLDEIMARVGPLLEAGKFKVAENVVRELAAEKNPKIRAGLARVAEKAASGRKYVEEGKLRGGMTVSDFAKQWISGELHKQYPDHVAKKDARRDEGILKTYVEKPIGDIPLVAIDLDHIQSVMRGIPEERSSATRRHVAQFLYRLFHLAVFPCRALPASPMPRGFLPWVKRQRVSAFLYPREDVALLSCPNVDLARRLLYGFLHREGMRMEEAVSIEWSDLDLEHGTVRLDENKTGDTRAWALDAGTLDALRAWDGHKSAPDGSSVFPEGVLPLKSAEAYRADLKAAGVTRPELWIRSDVRRPVRLHDTRTAFVTIALANGKSEVWVMDRTGHRSSTILQRYRRVARTAAELGLGSWSPLGDAIPELAGLGSDWDPSVAKRRALSRNRLKIPQNATSDDAGREFKIRRPYGREGSSPSFGTSPASSNTYTAETHQVGEPAVTGAGSQSDPKRPSVGFGPRLAALDAARSRLFRQTSLAWFRRCA